VNLIKKFSIQYNGKYFEGENRSFISPAGILKSQRVQCRIDYKRKLIDLFGNYQLGGKIELLREEPLYVIVLNINSKFESFHFYPKNKIQQFLYRMRIVIFKRSKNSLRAKYNYNVSRDTKKLVQNIRFVELMSKSTVYISTRSDKINTRFTLNSTQGVDSFFELENLFEIMTVIVDEIIDGVKV